MIQRIIFAALLVAFQVSAPERVVRENVIISDHDPKLQIQLPKQFRYLGADRWDLYGIADCELHAFVEDLPDKKVGRLYWVQFEGYLPTKPDLVHQYDSPVHTTIAGMDFFVDTYVRAKDEKDRPGSDREHIEQLIRSKGYSMPEGMMYVRLVHLLDNTKRKELMIIYGEDLAPLGYKPVDLVKGGKDYDRWPAVSKALVERAQAGITIADVSP